VAAPEESGVQGATVFAKGKATDLSLSTEDHLRYWLLNYLFCNGLHLDVSNLDWLGAFDSA
jgi:hypothetical protein